MYAAVFYLQYERIQFDTNVEFVFVGIDWLLGFLLIRENMGGQLKKIDGFLLGFHFSY